MDVDNIPVGVDFVTHLNGQVAACDAVLVVIGPNWLKAKDKAGQRRLAPTGRFRCNRNRGGAYPRHSCHPCFSRRGTHAEGERAAGCLKAARTSPSRRGAPRRISARMPRRWSKECAKSLGDKTLDKGGPETVGDKAAVVLELERLAAQEREAKAEAETEAKRKADEAEQQRLAAAKAEQERQVREVAEAQRQANIRAEQERQKQAEAEARQQAELEARRLEAKRRAEEEQQRKQLERQSAGKQKPNGARTKRNAVNEQNASH